MQTNAPSALQHSTTDQGFFSALQNSTHSFLQPPENLYTAALGISKRYLDPIAASTSQVQIERQQKLRRKRKRGESHSIERPLHLKEIYLEGLRVEQIWEQAKRVLDASRLEVERSLPGILQEPGDKEDQRKPTKVVVPNGKAVRFRDEIDAISLNTDAYDEVFDESELIGEANGPYADDESIIESQDHLDDEDDEVLSEDDIDQDFDDEDSYDDDGKEESHETFIPDKLGLNDGFFSIDDFNRQSEFLEQQDARGENDGAASDEEDVDWNADPLATTLSRDLRSDQEYDDEEDGPTFGNADLNEPDLSDDEENDSDNDIEMGDTGEMNNTNDIQYADFFEPPPRKAIGPKGRRALPKTQPPPPTAAPREESEDDVQRTISAVRRDIFEDDLTPDEDEAVSDTNDTRSSHQKRQAALTAEIKKLESAAVAKRDWTLSGEARAADRPINSLLEEDLEFERAGKPIPVITQEVSEDIEALIKRRILARDFDEVIRRRPGSLATGGPDVRRGRFELDDTKPQQSLAEIYEAEHLKTVDPSGYIDKRDEKLKREHAKIEQMWKDVSSKLDALSSWHFKPKPPSANINVVADVPTISMEDARPAAGGELGGESMLAPQEVYKAGEARNKKEEVLTRSGLPFGREEMTRDEKTRRRRREKERIRKAGGLLPAKGGMEISKKTKEKQGIVGDLKKGGVKVIGKKGEIRDVQGNAVKSRVTVGKGAGGYKL
ncbi:U3 small nucleolar RNA-associated protein MPP10, partial [Lecanoromycetidae sp. Uapishka_2]